jgi:hypothetical protein
MRKALNEYLTILMNSEVDEHASCCSFSSLSRNLVSVWESFLLKKMRIRSNSERLILIVKKFQNEISIVRTAAQKYDVCRNIIINKNRVKRIIFEFFMNRQLLSSHKEKIILKFVNNFIELRFFLRLFMLKEKVKLILRERKINTNFRRHWDTRFLIRHLEYQSKFLRLLDQVRHFNFDSVVFEQWFELFRKIYAKYDIVCENIYNINEKKYMMKINDTCKLVLRHILIYCECRYF